jgi:small subunit ribosomal protein S1
VAAKKTKKTKKSSKGKTVKSSKNKKAPRKRSSSSRGEPKTMDELMAKYGQKEPSVGLSMGDMVEGEVLEITPKRVVMDIGGKSEGLVAEKAFKEAQSFIGTLEVGDKVETKVLVPETPDGYTILSLRQASKDAAWKKIEIAHDDEEPIEVDGKSINSSGVMVDVGGLTGFIPRSQLGEEAGKNTQSLIGKKIEVLVLDVDRNENRIVLSEKEVSEADKLKLQRQAMKGIKEGDDFEGEVTTIYDFGCFVKIDVPVGKGKKKEDVELEGLVHISEMAWGKVSTPSDVVSVGDKVKVQVIGKKAGKLALSMKQTKKDPWDTISKKYKKDDRVKGKVTNVSDFGVFVQLEPGVEGLLHVTKIPPNKKFKEGDKVEVYIEEVDKKERKISLGLVLKAKPVGYK